MNEVKTDSPKKKGCLFYLAIIFGVLVFLVVVGAIFGPAEEEQAKIDADKAAEQVLEAERQQEEAISIRDTAIKVTVSELFNAYENNEAAAQQQYGGKLLEVTGKVDGVDLDFSDTPIVKLATSNQFLPASLYFTEEAQSQAASLSKGENRTFLCEDISEIIGTPQLKECVLAD